MVFKTQTTRDECFVLKRSKNSGDGIDLERLAPIHGYKINRFIDQGDIFLLTLADW